MDANANTALSPSEYLAQRIDDQIGWYNKKAGINKRNYYLCQKITVICGALIPLLIGYSDSLPPLKYFAGVMGAVIVIAQGFSDFKKYKDTWTAYRDSAEALTREKFLFQTQIGETLGESYPFELFVFKCENIMSGENSSWKLMQSNPDKKGKDS